MSKYRSVLELLNDSIFFRIAQNAASVVFVPKSMVFDPLVQNQETHFGRFWIRWRSRHRKSNSHDSRQTWLSIRLSFLHNFQLIWPQTSTFIMNWSFDGFCAAFLSMHDAPKLDPPQKYRQIKCPLFNQIWRSTPFFSMSGKVQFAYTRPLALSGRMMNTPFELKSGRSIWEIQTNEWINEHMITRYQCNRPLTVA